MAEIQNKAQKHGELKGITRYLRPDILDMSTRAGSGHPSSSFSTVEILTALYLVAIYLTIQMTRGGQNGTGS